MLERHKLTISQTLQAIAFDSKYYIKGRINKSHDRT